MILREEKIEERKERRIYRSKKGKKKELLREVMVKISLKRIDM